MKWFNISGKIVAWSCHNESKQGFFLRIQNLSNPQAFDPVAESLSNDGVWFRGAIKIHCQTTTMNRNNRYEIPAIYGVVLSRGFHHPK